MSSRLGAALGGSVGGLIGYVIARTGVPIVPLDEEYITVGGTLLGAALGAALGAGSSEPTQVKVVGTAGALGVLSDPRFP